MLSAVPALLKLETPLPEGFPVTLQRSGSVNIHHRFVQNEPPCQLSAFTCLKRTGRFN